jgi:AraC-like DNA-binding protein
MPTTIDHTPTRPPVSGSGPAEHAPPVLSRSYPCGTQLGAHMHREAQLLFASQGVMQVTTPKGRWLVPPQRAVWIPPRLEHAVDVLADIEMRALLVDPERLSAHPEAPRLQHEFVVAVAPLLRETILACFASAGAHPRRVDVLLELALYELAEAGDAATFVPLPTDARARRVAQLVLADPGNDKPLEDLAGEAGASARTVSRLFRDETTFSFKEWRQRARIVAAVEALGSPAPGPISVKQVAARVGFASAAAFGHAFKQVMGVTAGEMLRDAQGRR